ncbi:MAG: hypothetical protein IKA88_07330, partial [Clostridia bacterium]|nr:hypothetical protein [Clostridia bacterium]
MKKTKKIILGSLTAGLLMSACAAVGVMGVNDTTKANAASVPVTGTATEAVTAEQALTSFTMENKAGVRTATPNGIRFETSISAADLATLPNTATFGTLIIPKEVLGANALNLENTDALNIEANVWRSKSTAETFVYSGVLIGESAEKDFPEAEYATDLVAVSYVTYTYTPDGGEATTVTKYTSTVTRNMAYVAASALYDPVKPNPDTNGVLANILAKSVTNVDLGEDTTIVAGKTAELTVSTNVASELAIPAKIEVTGDAVTYENGVLTAVKAGTATVTATIGNVSDTMTVKVLNGAELAAQYSGAETYTVEVSALNLDGEVVATSGTYANDELTFTGLVSGDNAVTIDTATTRYSMNVIKYDMEISSMADIEAWAKGGKEGKYAVLTQDIDATGYVATNINMNDFASIIKHSSIYQQAWVGIGATWTDWNSGTLDGRGYSVENFFAWNMFGIYKDSVTVKNIGLKYDQWIQNVNHLDGVFGGITATYMTMENVWIDMTVSKDQVSSLKLTEWFVFGNTVQGCTIKDVIVNVNVIGNANVAIRSGAKAGTIANNIENVYVISTSTIGANTMNTWSDVKVISKPSEITSIGGNFVIEGNSIKYSGKTVYTWTKPNVAETVSERVYTESADFALADLGVTGTLVSATPAVVENGVLKATGLVIGDNVYTVVTETEDAIYTYTITIVRVELPREQLAQKYTDQAALDVAIASLNLEGTLVSVKTAAGVDVAVTEGIIECVDLVSGDNTFV